MQLFCMAIFKAAAPADSQFMANAYRDYSGFLDSDFNDIMKLS